MHGGLPNNHIFYSLYIDFQHIMSWIREMGPANFNFDSFALQWQHWHAKIIKNMSPNN